MSRRKRSALAAVVGAAMATAAAPTASAHEPAPAEITGLSAATDRTIAEAAQHQTLGSVIDARLARAHAAGRRSDIEQLATLWLTLRNRGQLDREVERGERFVSVALRNLQRSEHRTSMRQARCVPTNEPALATMAEARGSAWQSCSSAGWPDQQLAATELLERLDEPYRTAAALSATGMNRREVAEHMGVSHAAVRKWMQRLRERLAP